MTAPAAPVSAAWRAPWWVRWNRNVAVALAAAALAFWPFVGFYTSVGCEFEEPAGTMVRGTYWRVRWPGDGSVVLACIVEHRPAEAGGLQPFDLGGVFLRRAQPIAAEGWWQRHGFWWVRVREDAPKVPPIVAGADRAMLAGVPHWLLTLVLLTGAAASVVQARRRAQSR